MVDIKCSGSSVAERQAVNLNVAGSIPVQSDIPIHFWNGSCHT
jgi:hypothetical protein